MNTYSPYGSTPGGAEYYHDKHASPSPTPSPRGPAYYYAQTPQRPQTRAHFRQGSAGFESFSPRYTSTGQYATANTPYTPFTDREAFASPHYEPDRRPAGGHARRGSTSMPQRPATARPASSHQKKHHIPKGYSLKNWDPTEEPIMLLGSVFDSNSLGKWIYDWTVYHHGPATPISDMAGELWLLLIQLSGKVKRAEECVPRIRTKENQEMIEDFIESGERLMDKLRKLLKACEAPMLKASKRKDSQLGKNSGIEFVETLFGRERELAKTEQFMQSVRLWNLRFDANCEEVIKKPTM